MPRQNRVLPTGEIVVSPMRGALMGNRGILHDETGELGRSRWRHHAWVTCRLAFKGRRREIMTPRRYTELFFLDEAVALAAGHRPCAECRRADHRRFAAAWAAAEGGEPPSAPAMDSRLQAARIETGTRRQRRFRARLAELPDGVFALDAEGTPALVWQGRLRPLATDRYGPPAWSPTRDGLLVLTPLPTVRAIAAGYVPQVAILD